MKKETVRVESYLLADGCLVRVQDFVGEAVDPDYIEGAITLDVGQTSLLTPVMVDLVDQLWAYLVTGLDAIARHQPFQTFFPDQAIRLRLNRDSRSDRVSIEVVGTERAYANVPYGDFVDAVSKEAQRFFAKMTTVAPRNKAAYEQSIRKLQKWHL